MNENLSLEIRLERVIEGKDILLADLERQLSAAVERAKKAETRIAELEGDLSRLPFTADDVRLFIGDKIYGVHKKKVREYLFCGVNPNFSSQFLVAPLDGDYAFSDPHAIAGMMMLARSSCYYTRTNAEKAGSQC